MGVGSNTVIRFTGKREDLDRIFEIGNDADEGDLYLRAYGITNEEYDSWSDEQERDFLYDVGVNSMCQAYCSASRGKDDVTFTVYSTYETPMGVWDKIAENFPEVDGYGTVVREDDPNETEGEIYIHGGYSDYTCPEDMDL